MNKPLLHGAGGGGPKKPSVADISVTTDDVSEINLGICQGPAVGLYNGPRTFFFDDTPLMSKSGDNNFNPFELHVYHGDDTPTPVRNALGGLSSNTVVGVQLAKDIPVVRVTPISQQNEIDAIEVRLLINRLGKFESDGDVKVHTLKLEMKYREEGQTEWQNFVAGQDIVKITGRIEGAVREFTRRVPRTTNNWEIKVVKLNDDDDASTKPDDVAWESFQTTTMEDRAYDNLLVVRGLSEASDQISSLPTFSGVYGGLIFKIPSNYDPVTRHYSGVWDGTWKDGFTDNPAWALYELLTNPEFGARRYWPDLQVDRFSFYSAAQWCDELVPRGDTNTYQPRYTYNDTINEIRGGKQTLGHVAAVFNGVLTQDAGGTVVLEVDRPGTPTQIFGPESVTAEGFQYQYTDVETRHNEAKVTFENPDLLWETDERLVEIQEFIDANGRNTIDFTAVGCNDVFEAQRRAFMHILQANTETCLVSFRTARQSLMLKPFGVIGVVDPDQRWGVSGRIKSVAGSTIHLRDPLYLPTNTSLTMSVTSPSGVTDLTVQSATTTTWELTITSGSLPGDLPSRAQFSLTDDGSTLGLVKPFRVISITEDEQEPDLASVTALEINTNKWSDADNMTLSELIEYDGEGFAGRQPQDIRVQSGDDEVVKHKDGTTQSRLRVSWRAPRGYTVEISYYRLGVDEPQVIKGFNGEAFIGPVQAGETYVIQLQGTDVRGKLFQPTEPLFHTVDGKTVGPSTPTGWTATEGVDTITLRGPKSDNKDFAFFRIYGVEVDDSTTYLDQVSTTIYVRRPPDGDLYSEYRVSELDTTGLESPLSAPITATPTKVRKDDLDTDLKTDLDDTWTLVSHGDSVLVSEFDIPLALPDSSFGDPGVIINSTAYPTGRDVEWVLNADDQAGRRVVSNDATAWPGPADANAFLVEADFTLVSGTAEGAGILVDWEGDAQYRVIKPLQDMVQGSIRTGVVMRASAVFEKPAGFSGAFTYNEVFFMAGFAGFAPVTAKTIQLHKIRVSPISSADRVVSTLQADLQTNYYTIVGVDQAIAAESTILTASINGVSSDVTSLEATLQSNYYTSADVDQAIAAESTILTAAIDGVSADVTTNTSAIADVEAGLTASYVLRAKAGGSSADFELVAWDNAQGGGSVIKMNADLIVLEGTMSGDRIRANTISAGHLKDMDASNLVPNPSMEDGAFGWTLKHAGTVVPTPTGDIKTLAGAWESRRAFEINHTGNEFASFESQPFVVHPGQSLYVSAQFGNVTGGAAFLQLQFAADNDFSNSTLLKIGDNVTSASVTKVEDVITVPADSYVCKLRLIKVNDGTTTMRAGAPVVRHAVGGDMVDTVSFASYGLSLFGGAIQSTNYVPGTAGWRIGQDGTMELKDLVIRDSIVEGAVSDGGANYGWTTSTVQDGTAINTLGDLGPSSADYTWWVIVRAKIRECSTLSGSPTRIMVQWRAWLDTPGSWTAWTDITADYLIKSASENWEDITAAIPFIGEHDKIGFRLLVSTGNGDPTHHNNLDGVHLYARSMRR